MQKHLYPARTFPRHAGFTLIELMIVLAAIAVIVSLALPVYTSYTIRAKVEEALSVTAAAKAVVSATCIENPTIGPLTDKKVRYSFTASKYVTSVEFSGTCQNPVISITTRNTGAPAPIQLVVSGEMHDNASHLSWVCTANTANRNVPRECRS